MAHGMPDDSDVETQSNVSKSLDLSELAIRLGAVPSFDRRGDVVYWHDFSGGFGMLNAYDSSGAIAQLLCNDMALNSGVSLFMKAPNVEDSYAAVYFAMVVGQTTSFGAEFLYSIKNTCKSLSILLPVQVGGLSYLYWADVVFATGEVLAYNDAGAWEQVGVHTCYVPDVRWMQSLKLVLDLGNQRYGRLVFNNSTYLLTAVHPFVAPTASPDGVDINFRARSPALTNAEAYLLGLILTQNEPL